jgi:hypothetical protein
MMATAYLWLLCYAPRWLVRALPGRWRRQQLAHWMEKHAWKS